MGKKQSCKFYGWIEDWGENPDRVKQCKEKAHKVIKQRIGCCQYRIICDVCHYFYKTTEA